MIGHSTVISGIAANQRHILTAGYDRRVILWDAARHTPLAVAYHDHLANQVRFSPDGTLALSTSSDFTARLWSVPKMELIAVLSGHTDDIECAEFHPDLPLIATASFDDTIGLFDFEGNLVKRLRGHDSDVNTVFWKDATTLISTGDDGTIRIWDVTTGENTATFEVSEVETDTVCNGPGQITFCGNDAGEIIALNGQQITNRIAAHDAGIKRLIYVPQTAQLVSSSYDGFVRFWAVDAEGGCRDIGRFAFPHNVWPRSCDHLEGDTFVFATFGSTYATFDRSTGVWDTSRVAPSGSLNCVYEHLSELVSIGDAGTLLSPGGAGASVGRLCNTLRSCGTSLLTGGHCGTIWDLVTGDVLYTHVSPINGGGDVIVQDGRCRTMLGAYTGDVLVFEADEQGQARFVEARRIADNSVKDIALAPGTSLAVIATGAGMLFDTQTLEPLREVAGHDEVANACTTIQGGFASVGRDLKLVLWNSDGSIRARLVTPHFHSIKTVCHSDGVLWLGDYRGFVSSYDIARDQFGPLRRIAETGVSSLCATRNGGIYAASYDGAMLCVAQPPVRAGVA